MIHQIPKIAGLWEYQLSIFRRNNSVEIPDLNNIIVIPPEEVEITQNNEFVVAKLPVDFTRPKEGYLLGTLTKTYQNGNDKFFWTLTFADYDDNGVFTLTASDVDCNGNILEWSGNYIESGFVGSPVQLQTVGIIKFRRILLK